MFKESELDHRTGFEIAIIGLSGKFPGAADIDEFWENLKNGVESVTFMADEELRQWGVEDDLIGNPDYVKTKGGVLDRVDHFDAAFFGYTPREAEVMDPQFRLLHECVWRALEDAGYDPACFGGTIGLYAGASTNFNWEALLTLSGKDDDIGDFVAQQLVGRDFLCSRISYKFGLRGPSVVIQTACSTSLSAVHTACRGLLGGECDMALAGGVAVSFRDKRGYLYGEGMIKSPDGHCRAFDAGAKGTIRGDGVGIVVLKPLEEALSAGDHIYALVKGSAVNNDGSRKIGFTAPSIEGQSRVIKRALHMADVRPESISYIEAHGTGTEIGDPIEFEALRQAFAVSKRGFCGIGSVKTNIGHLDAAAGIAGFVKTVLALNYRLIPPTLHFMTPNPKIDFAASPFFVVNKLTAWKSGPYPLRAGVNAFGLGGTNAHVILEEAPRLKASAGSRPWKLLVLSAHTHTALEKMTQNFAEYLRKFPAVDLADVAFTLQSGRKSFKYRRMLVCASAVEGVEILTSSPSRRLKTFRGKKEKNQVVFMLAGLGSQYVNMGLELYVNETVFREEMDRCFKILESIKGYDLKDILYLPETLSRTSGIGAGERGENNRARNRLSKAEFSQPLLFAFEYALAKLLIHWGIRPDMMIGYSLGEYVAAVIAGVFSLKDALRVVAVRGRLVGTLAGGKMLSVPLGKEKLQTYLTDEISLAIDNGPSCIVTGPVKAVEGLEERLRSNKYICMPAPLMLAVHSHMMEPILEAFSRELGALRLNPPQIPFISNVTGTWITPQEAVDPAYWVKHLRQTVRFSEGINELMGGLNSEDPIIVEVGPGRDLSALVGRFVEDKPKPHFVNPLRHEDQQVSDLYFLLERVGLMWLYGAEIDWAQFNSGERRCRVSLPTYPFESRPFRIEGDLFKLGRQALSGQPGSGKKRDRADWFYAPSWQRADHAVNVSPDWGNLGPWLLLVDDDGLGDAVKRRLEKNGEAAVVVRRGQSFLKESDNIFVVNPRKKEDYEALMMALVKRDQRPRRIIHMWNVGGDEEAQLEFEGVNRVLADGFFSLLYLVQGLGNLALSNRLQIDVITDNMHYVGGDERLCPARATILGLVKVIPLEFSNIGCRNFDVVLAGSGDSCQERVVDQLLAESVSDSGQPVVAFRFGHRWEQVTRPVRLEKVGGGSGGLRDRGIYLITGGLGGIGLATAEYLIRSVKARIILTGRSSFPRREAWLEWLNSHDDDDETSRKIRQLLELEKMGGKILVFSADVSDEKGMRNSVAQAEACLGPINGVIHAAGIGGGGVIQLMTRDRLENVFAAKVWGTLVLEKIFRERSLDFFMLFSSLNSLYPNPGQADYCAANAFMDAVAAYTTFFKGKPVTAVNWGRWKNTGMSAAAKHRELTGRALPGGMSVAEGTDSFHRIVTARLSQVLVSKQELNQQDLYHRTSEPGPGNGGGAETASDPVPARYELTADFRAPEGDVERQLCDIWERFFGYSVGTDDNFFELGGDSLKATILVSKIYRELQVSVPLAEIFRSPTIKGLSGYIKNCFPDKGSSLRAVEEREYYRLSYNQKRLWLIHQLEPYSPAFHINSRISLNYPDFDECKKRVFQVFEKLVNRHESLRAGFKMVGEEPVHYVKRQVEIPLRNIDLSSLPGGESELARKRIVREETETPFRLLSDVPLFKALLVKVSETRYELVVSMHHIISDGWSLDILGKEFFRAFKSGTEKDLDGDGILRVQYKDFARWHNSLLTDKESLARAVEFWTHQLKEYPPPVDLPYDYPPGEMKSKESGGYRLVLPAELRDRLKHIAGVHQASLFMVLLAAFNLLLSNISGQQDTIIGVPGAGRRFDELRLVIGFFINTLLVRNQVDRDETFSRLLGQVQENTLRVLEYQDYPLELICSRQKIKYPHISLFFNMLNMGEGELQELENVGSYHLEQVNEAKFEIVCYLQEYSNGIEIVAHYYKNLFLPSTIENIMTQYVNMLREVAQNPLKKLDEYCLRSRPQSRKKRIALPVKR